MQKHKTLNRQPPVVAPPPALPPELTPRPIGDLLDDAQAAAFLSITSRTLRLWRQTQGLPHFKITAKIIRYRRSDLDAWVNRRRTAVAA